MTSQREKEISDAIFKDQQAIFIYVDGSIRHMKGHSTTMSVFRLARTVSLDSSQEYNFVTTILLSLLRDNYRNEGCHFSSLKTNRCDECGLWEEKAYRKIVIKKNSSCNIV